MIYVVNLIIKTDKQYCERKPDEEMIKELIKDRICGEINEKLFRCNVVLKINDVEVYVKKVV